MYGSVTKDGQKTVVNAAEILTAGVIVFGDPHFFGEFDVLYVVELCAAAAAVSATDHVVIPTVDPALIVVAHAPRRTVARVVRIECSFGVDIFFTDHQAIGSTVGNIRKLAGQASRSNVTFLGRNDATVVAVQPRAGAGRVVRHSADVVVRSALT